MEKKNNVVLEEIVSAIEIQKDLERKIHNYMMSKLVKFAAASEKEIEQFHLFVRDCYDATARFIKLKKALEDSSIDLTKYGEEIKKNSAPEIVAEAFLDYRGAFIFSQEGLERSFKFLKNSKV